MSKGHEKRRTDIRKKRLAKRVPDRMGFETEPEIIETPEIETETEPEPIEAPEPEPIKIKKKRATGRKPGRPTKQKSE